MQMSVDSEKIKDNQSLDTISALFSLHSGMVEGHNKVGLNVKKTLAMINDSMQDEKFSKIEESYDLMTSENRREEASTDKDQEMESQNDHEI